MNPTPKYRTQMWIAGIILAVLYFAPSIAGFVRQWMFYRQQTTFQTAPPVGGIQDRRRRQGLPAVPGAPKPMPGAAGNPQDPSTVAPGADPNTPTQSDNMLGTWQGIGPLPGNQMCTLKIEIRTNSQVPGSFSGFPVLICAPFMPGFVRRGAAAQNTVLVPPSPVSAVLTGTAKDGSIEFTVEKTIGTTVSGCALTKLTITPFGTDQIAAQWAEGTCEGGQILLRRIGK